LQKSEKGKKSERRVEWSYIGLGKKKGRELLVLAINNKTKQGREIEWRQSSCARRGWDKERRKGDLWSTFSGCFGCKKKNRGRSCVPCRGRREQERGGGCRTGEVERVRKVKVFMESD